MTFFAIVGHGPNDLEIPLVICQTRDEAEAIVGQLPIAYKDNWLDEKFAEEQFPYRENEPDYEYTEEGKRLYGLIFKKGSYYSGCGGCYRVTIEEFEFGQPMVGWDLD